MIDVNFMSIVNLFIIFFAFKLSSDYKAIRDGAEIVE